MRVSYCYAVRDQNRLVYQADEEFVASLPAELQGPMQRWFDRFKIGLDDAMDMFEVVPFAAPQQAPGEDPAGAGQPALVLRQGADACCRDASAKYDVPMHMHLLETAYQKEYAWRRGELHGAGIHRPLRHARTAA